MGVKASMFGAYEGNWQTPLAVIAAIGLAAAAVACWVGLWRFVPWRDMHPAMDI
jgi:putative membrane protein